MARLSTRLLTCPPMASTSRIKAGTSEYDVAFKLTRQALSSKEGEIVMLFIPKRKDGASKPAQRRKTSAR